METDTPLTSRLRQRMAGSKTSIRAISMAAGVDYHQLWRWYTGSTRRLDAETADKVMRWFDAKEEGGER